MTNFGATVINDGLVQDIKFAKDNNGVLTIEIGGATLTYKLTNTYNDIKDSLSGSTTFTDVLELYSGAGTGTGDDTVKAKIYLADVYKNIDSLASETQGKFTAATINTENDNIVKLVQ